MKQYKVIQDCYLTLDGTKPIRYRIDKIIEVRDGIKPPKRFFQAVGTPVVVEAKDGTPLSKAVNRPKLSTGMAYKAPEEAKGIIDSPIMESAKVSRK